MKKLLIILSLFCVFSVIGFTACDCNNSGCGNISEHVHEYDEGVVKAANCVEQGYTLYTCRTCGESFKDRYTPSLGHDYIIQVVPASCIAKGYTTHTCSRCNDIYTDNETETLPHDYQKSGSPIANCALSIQQKYVCSVCEDITYKTVENTGDVVIPDIHNHIEDFKTCDFCGFRVDRKNGDSVLMAKAIMIDDNNYEWQYSSEHYGTTTNGFDDNNYKDKLVNVYIADSVTQIIQGAFSYCSNLTSVYIPNSVWSIGDSAFYACYRLTRVNIPSGVKSISRYAFSACESLAEITIPDSVTSIGNFAFSGCKKLTRIEIPDSVKSIGQEAFKSSGLEEIVIGKSVTSIGRSAFSQCSSLKSVKIPESVTSIGDYAFYYCKNLTSIRFNGTKAQWKVISKDANWNNSVPATVVQCDDGEVAI